MQNASPRRSLALRMGQHIPLTTRPQEARIDAELESSDGPVSTVHRYPASIPLFSLGPTLQLLAGPAARLYLGRLTRNRYLLVLCARGDAAR